MSLDPSAPAERHYSADVKILDLDEREFILVGTAHISQQSVDLDSQRYQALSEQRKWEALDLKQIIRNRQLSTLIVNLVLASYQKRLVNVAHAHSVF